MDISILLFLQRIRELTAGIFDPFMLQMTALAQKPVTYLLLAFVYWCYDKRCGQLMGLNVATSCTWVHFLKGRFKVDRPWVRDGRIHPVESALSGAGDYSFPSGHTQRAAAAWGAAGYGICRDTGDRRDNGAAVPALICFIVPLFAAFSRLYLGVHTPQDVLFALAFGAGIIFLTDLALRWVESGTPVGAGGYRDIIVAVIGCLICFLPMLKTGCMPNAGEGMGFFIGWLLERRFVGFEASGGRSEKAVRFGIGALGVIVIQNVLPSLLSHWMNSRYAGFFSGFALAVFIMALYPFFFSKRSRYKAGIIAAVVAILLLGICGMITYRHDKLLDEARVQAAHEAEPLIIAHRGYSGVYPENTLAAFEGAVDIGADMVELDVQLSKDGVVVILHDDTLERTAGREGSPADYTFEELSQMDAGSWFDPQFSDEAVPSLAQAMDVLEDTGLGIYLELKDIGDVPGFEEAVLSVAREYDMADRCIFASFRYEYLDYFREQGCKTLLNISSYDESLPQQYEADYYGLYVDGINADVVSAIHAAGKKAMVWTVDTSDAMKEALYAGADGIVTNQPGRMKVLVHSEYSFISECFKDSFAVPGLYGCSDSLGHDLSSYVVQGFSEVPEGYVVTAYSKNEGENSILFLLDGNGRWTDTVDLGFCAHTGGTAYDKEHNLLWITGPEGNVYAIEWSGFPDMLYCSFQAGLKNHSGSAVASFLDVYDGKLYVGSYCDGVNGKINCFDISSPEDPVLLRSFEIPQRIQGVTFIGFDNGGGYEDAFKPGISKRGFGFACI